MSPEVHIKEEIIPEEKPIYVASQWKLMWLKFKKHKLALTGGTIIIVFYLLAIFCEFFSPYDIQRRTTYIYCPPTKIHFIDGGGKFYIRPFVYKIKSELDTQTFRWIYTEDKSQKYFIKFFCREDEYKFWGLFRTNIHLFGVNEGYIFLFGTDSLGRDLFSRTISASRISLSIGLVGVFLSLIIGSLLGGISGYSGGTVDIVIQRIIEFFTSMPTLPLWMALSAALPPTWPQVKVYFGITIILSLIGWCGVARVVRGRTLQMKEEDYIMAAKITGVSSFRIIATYLVPGCLSYLIVSLTLSIPSMILGETSLSFLGLGLRPPAVSWGILLQDAQKINTLANCPWLLIPGVFVFIVVLAFNFLGDGLRDAADPYR